jgi:2-oxoglutarate dehydrogenase E2 component (dihydrolipoamide succinyltransferase)
MTRIVKLREKEKNKYEQRNGVKLTYMPFITRAAIVALKKHPIVNGSIEGEAIRYNKNINIGIAVALDWGLIVPVIKQTEEKSFLGIARSIVDVAERARGKKLAPDEITDKDGADAIAIRSIQRFTLGFDHRIVDGADAGKFMSDFKAYLENWAEDIG